MWIGKCHTPIPQRLGHSACIRGVKVPIGACYFPLHIMWLVQEQLLTVKNGCCCRHMVGISYVNLYKTKYLCLHCVGKWWKMRINVYCYVPQNNSACKRLIFSLPRFCLIFQWVVSESLCLSYLSYTSLSNFSYISFQSVVFLSVSTLKWTWFPCPYSWPTDSTRLSWHSSSQGRKLMMSSQVRLNCI